MSPRSAGGAWVATATSTSTRPSIRTTRSSRPLPRGWRGTTCSRSRWAASARSPTSSTTPERSRRPTPLRATWSVSRSRSVPPAAPADLSAQVCWRPLGSRSRHPTTAPRGRRSTRPPQAPGRGGHPGERRRPLCPDVRHPAGHPVRLLTVGVPGLRQLTARRRGSARSWVCHTILPVSADYEKIREENIARYGWDTAVLDLLGQLYSERTHFIFELIQNAEDAGATELTFELFDDRLEVAHDGRPFTEADVRGICGVGQSGKSGDLTKIGQFGIGFKSVYAYTKTPRVYSSGEHFRIENYVRPFSADPPDEPPPGTLFVFPFDHDTVPAATAVAEISSALNEIEPVTLLFLRNIGCVRTRGAGGAGSVLERGAERRTSSRRHITLAEGRGHEDWFVWHRPLGDVGHPAHRVEIAFRADIADGEPRLVRRDDAPLVVFFPAQKETFLSFLIQGPYRTTPARDNVPEHDPSNQALVRETAVLLADVLRELRDDRLLTVDVLQALPLDATRFQPGTMFRPLFDSVRTALAHEEFIPVTGGGYGAAGELKLAGGAGLRELLRPDQLGLLYAAGQPLAFADESITGNRTPLLWRYLREEIGLDEVTPEAVVARATREFLVVQSDEWIRRFYEFLYRDSTLWRAPRFPGEQPGPARTQPIIRLEDGSQVAPLDSV